MNKTKTKIIYENAALLYTILFWVLITGLSIITPAADTTSRYDISDFQLVILKISLSLIQLIIWIVLALAVRSVYRYFNTIKRSAESVGFRYVKLGLTAMLLGLISAGFITALSTYYYQSINNADLTDTFTILRNYSTIILNIAAYFVMYKASSIFINTLLGNDKLRISPKYVTIPIVIAIVLGLYYTTLILGNESRTLSVDPNITPTFALNDTLILFTIILPTIVSWIFAFLSLSYFSYLVKHVKGYIYKQFFIRFIVGLTLVVSLSVVLQIVTQFSAYWASAGIGFILIIVYLIYAIWTVGFLFINKSVKKLLDIEAV